MQKVLSHQSGITLLELIIATAIISVISTLSISAYSGYIETTKVSQAVTQIRTVSFLIENYASDYDEYPETLRDIDNEGLKDPWGNPYVYLNLKINAHENDDEDSSDDEHSSYDSWHKSDDDRINISAARKDGNLVPINTEFDLYSFGKDGKSKPPLRAKDSHDDVIFANDGGYIGLASEF